MTSSSKKSKWKLSDSKRKDHITAAIVSEISTMLKVPERDITPTRAFIELGAQSLDFVELVLRLERSFRIQLPRSLMIPGEQSIRHFVHEVDKALRANATEHVRQ